MEKLIKLLLNGNIDGAISFIEENLGKYGKVFRDYYEMFYSLQVVFRPEEYVNRIDIIRSSLIVILKKAYRDRDPEMVKKIKEFIEILEDFSGEEDDIS